ncbi:MAG TPA: CDP-alcohol phosphatidyltransferase family protein [Natronosporangium sp.]
MEWDQYAVAWADQHGGYDQRRAPATVRGWLWSGYALARGLAAIRVTPAAVTTVGLAAALAVPMVAAADPDAVLVAAGLALLSTIAGTLGRALRVLTRRTGPGAAIAEAVADRLGEAGWLVGFWLLGVPGPLVLGCGVLTGLYEYLRAQALAAGVSAVWAQTQAERPMRAVVAVAGLTLAGLVGLAQPQLGAGVLALAVASWLVLTTHGLGQLTTMLRRSFQ